MTGGYVRLYRKILDNPAFRDVNEAMFFAYLVLLANWKAGEKRYEDRQYNLNRGDFVVGERRLADAFGWSHKKVRGLLGRLRAEGMITRKRTQHGAQRAPVISICNYDIYQAQADEGEPASGTAGAQGGHREGTANKEKEGKEGKEGKTHTVDFDEFWRVYPDRKPHSNPKKPAGQKFEIAVGRGVPAGDIIRGAQNYATYVQRERVQSKYVAQAVTWISQERWTEYQGPPPEAPPADDGWL